MDVELVAQVRDVSGKGASRRLRAQAQVPAVLYGPKMEPLKLSVSSRRLERLLKDMGEESRLLELTLEGVDDRPNRQVLIREVQTHPVRRRFLHVDFYEVPLDHAIELNVPVELVGEAIGVRKGGTLNLIRRMLSIRCLPGQIPEKVQVDVSELEQGDSIYVHDLVGQGPFEFMDDPNHAVVNVVAPEGSAGEEEEATA